MCPACLSAAALLLMKAVPAGAALPFIVGKIAGRTERAVPLARAEGVRP